MTAALRQFNPDEGAEPLGTFWTIQHGQREAECTIRTHVLGWELTLFINGELYWSQVCKTESEVSEISGKWRAVLLEKGWA
jgi:hypothetical protein